MSSLRTLRDVWTVGHIDNLPTKFNVGLRWPAPPAPEPDGRLGSASEVVRLLKSLFSSRYLSAIAIGGWPLENEWLEEQGEPDPMLRSVFSRHVYVRSARPQHLSGFVEEGWREYVALRTRGVTRMPSGSPRSWDATITLPCATAWPCALRDGGASMPAS